MFKMDTGSTLADIRALQTALQRVEDRRTALVAQTAQYGINLVRERIQTEGQDANGSPMITKSPEQLGRYSKGWGSVRQGEGLRTDIVNLTFSGELLNSESWMVIEDADGAGAGFREDNMAQRAEWLEEAFDAPIFQLSAPEEQATVDYFEHALTDLMTVQF